MVGRPNVGKSTLMNRLIGVRLSIATHKPQTTRHQVLGVVTRDHTQMVFVDTPGYHLGEKRAINRYMNRAALGSLNDVDVVVFVVQAMRFSDEDKALLNRIKKTDLPVIAVVNKVDVLDDKNELLPFMQMLNEQHDFVSMLPISARKGQGVDALEGELTPHLPEQPHIFEEDDFTDRNMRFLAAERIREQLFLNMQQEIPYATTVEIEQFKEEAERFVIHAVIWVERASQKGMVIGKGGQRLKEVGTRARQSIARLLDTRVHLELWVRVKEGWSDDERSLTKLGYSEQGEPWK
ncbi:GTP-binding protein Era [gamma proteobacterium HTCC5015]|nr:GTP-binding protein Era [gamma proteobacterium HTCC5015]